MGIPSRLSDPKDVMILEFKTEELNKLYKGKRLSEIAAMRKKNANETMLDLIVEDRSNIPCIFFLMKEENVKRMLQLPYVSICSDAASIANEPPYNEGNIHPRAYGSFARLIGKYSRDEKLMPMEEAIKRMTSLPASNLKIKKRGTLAIGNYADIVIFDAALLKDNATFEQPHQYATGVQHVFVNGVQVLKDSEHTGKMPGRLVTKN
jgi:N-acyl-D-amino-acid deacylase